MPLPTTSSAEQAAGGAGSRDSSQPLSPALQQTRTAAQRPAGRDSSLLAALPAGVPVEGGLAPAEMAQLMTMVERLEEELFSSETMRNEVEVGRFGWRLVLQLHELCEAGNRGGGFVSSAGVLLCWEQRWGAKMSAWRHMLPT